RACNLLRRQAAEQAEGERDPCLTREDRMAGDEHQPQYVVSNRVVQRGVHLAGEVPRFGVYLVTQLGVLALVKRAASQVVYGAIPGCGHEPGAGVVGNS